MLGLDPIRRHLHDAIAKLEHAVRAIGHDVITERCVPAKKEQILRGDLERHAVNDTENLLSRFGFTGDMEEPQFLSDRRSALRNSRRQSRTIGRDIALEHVQSHARDVPYGQAARLGSPRRALREFGPRRLTQLPPTIRPQNLGERKPRSARVQVSPTFALETLE